MNHTDLETYKNITNIGYFRDRPAPIVIEYKKNNEEDTDAQQTILDAEMETKETSTETNDVTKMGFQITFPVGT